MQLFQLLMLCVLATKPVDTTIAVRASRELSRAGIRTASAVLATDHSVVRHTLECAHYVCHGTGVITDLIAVAAAVRDDYDGDLRNLAVDSRHNRDKAEALLRQVTGIGEAGPATFLREVQDIWPWVRPYFDELTIRVAAELGLPATPEGLFELAPRSSARLGAALTRASLDGGLRAGIVASSQARE